MKEAKITIANELKPNDMPAQRGQLSEHIAIVGLNSKGEIDTPIRVRIHYTRSGAAYAYAWVHASECNKYGNGYGKASGYGYDKASAAACAAMAQLGIDIEDRGILDLTRNLARAAELLGYKGAKSAL